jgi:O-antigen/teichoic acid export membrane protein
MRADAPETVTAAGGDALPPTPHDYKRGFAWTFFFSIFNRIATPLIGLVVARQLGPEIMGLYVLLQTTLSLAEIFRDGGIAQVFLNDTELNERRERSYSNLAAGLGVLMALALAGLSGSIASFFGRPELSWSVLFVAGALAINGFNAIPLIKLYRQGRFRDAGLVETGASLFAALCGLTLVLLDFGFFALVLQLFLRSAVMLILTTRLVPCRLGRGESGAWRRMVRLSASLTGVNVLWMVYSTADQFLIGRLLGVTSAGFYGMGKYVIAASDVLAKPLTQTVTVAFAHKAADAVALRSAMYKSIVAFMIAVAPIYLVVAVLAEPIILTLLTSKYAGTVPLMAALCTYSCSRYPGAFAGNALFAGGRPYVALGSWAVAYAVIATLLVVGWSELGLVQIAWLFAFGLLVANTITLVVGMIVYRPDRRVVLNLAKAVLALAATGGLALCIRSLDWGHGATTVLAVATLPIAHAAAIGILFVSHPFRAFSRSGIKDLWNRF